MCYACSEPTDSMERGLCILGYILVYQTIPGYVLSYTYPAASQRTVRACVHQAALDYVVPGTRHVSAIVCAAATTNKAITVYWTLALPR